ncbi:AGAP013133-PA-like protein [Anopheles sinensis]|uniref:AGAP013133-PA-like protein n=1 Tax=Anopheles sinensis TaxID=74873 RepID=A0A084VDK2_ANOSI|nr:AGAP013133-PA-like protein [Anopheles sinensis]
MEANKRKKLTPAKTRRLADKLKTACAIYLDPTIRSPNIQREKALKVLRKIVRRSPRDVIQYIPERDAILECSLVLVQNYVAHIRLRPSAFGRHFRKEPFSDAKALFQGVINLLIPELQDEVIDTILAFLQTENLWKVEFICVEILLFVLECHSPSALVLSKLIDQIERFLGASDVGQVRHVLSVLQNVTVPQHWDMLEYSELSKLLRFYHSSVTIGTSRNQIYELRRGFERCLKNLIALLSMWDLYGFCITVLPLAFDTEMSDEARIEFGSTVEYAASKVSLYSPSCFPSASLVVEYLLRHIASEDATRCILACKVLSKLLDRGLNEPGQFQSPKVFHIDTYYPIALATDVATLRRLFIAHRVLLEQVLLQAFDHHSHRQMHLEVFYQLLCTLLVEIPDGFTDAAVVCMLLEVQKRFQCIRNEPLKHSTNIATESSNRIHATIMAVMTLISWIERTGSLNEYVTRILKARYDTAPHLNPPLRERYTYAPHHVSWYEKDLFFDKLEIRFGLWKCFRIGEPKMPRPLRKRTNSNTDRRGRLSGTLKLIAGI